MNKTIKIILLGDANVGKTNYCKRVLCGIFDTKYVATLGAEVNTFNYYGNTIKIWDVAGNPKFSGEKKPYFLKSDGCIIMVDSTCESPFANVELHINQFRKACPDAPIIIVGNKNDNVNSDSKKNNKLLAEYKDLFGDIEYMDISVKSEFQLHMPFDYLLKLNK